MIQDIEPGYQQTVTLVSYTSIGLLLTVYCRFLGSINDDRSSLLRDIVCADALVCGM
jgi:hypothetical protein